MTRKNNPQPRKHQLKGTKKDSMRMYRRIVRECTPKPKPTLWNNSIGAT